MPRFITIIFFFILVGLAMKAFKHTPTVKQADEELPKFVASERAKLPRMLTKELKIEDLSYEDRTLHVDIASLVAIEYSPSDKARLQELMRANYCDKMQAFWQSNVGVEYAVHIPPQSINDTFTTLSIAVQPKDCPENI
jgi:hypothetical protein